MELRTAGKSPAAISPAPPGSAFAGTASPKICRSLSIDDDTLFNGLSADYLISENLKHVKPSVLKLKGRKSPYAKIMHSAQGIFAGPIGTGKTHLAIALGVEATKQKRRVLFTRAADLVRQLIEARDARELTRLQQRLKDSAAPKTINLEVGTIRAVLRRHRLWANLQPDVRMLSTPDDIGKALSEKDEKKLTDACADNRSRSLLPAVLLALNTGMRYSEIRLLHWQQVDLNRRAVRVGKSKTEAGTGRIIPLNEKATEVLEFWAELFPNREPEHFVFPSERYGAGGDKFEPTVYDVDPSKAITSWKEAWESVKKDTNIEIRFHDLRHTCVTRMLEGGVPLSVVASILGWSPATTARMAKRYGHIGELAQRQAVAVLDAKAKKPSRSKSTKRGHKRGTVRSPLPHLPL